MGTTMETTAKQTVWLIDDEPDLLETCAEMLSSVFEVRGFSSAEAVIQALEQGSRPSVFVTDIKMPGMDGLQLTERLRALNIDSPVIVVSGYADKSHAVKALGLGVFSLLDKPFHPAEYRHAVQKAAAHALLLDLTENLLTRYSAMIASMEVLLAKARDRYIAAENQIPEGPAGGDRRKALDFMREVVAESKLEDAVSRLKSEIEAAIKRRNTLRSGTR